ncbi:MAG: histidine kinase, partial [Saprospiraceae bacterium]|nr:histidine kinase [Saprospiraceae bacterium]
ELRYPAPLNNQKRVYHFEEWGEDLLLATTRNMVLWDRSHNRFQDIPTSVGGPIRDFVIDADDYAWVAANQLTPIRMSLPTGNYVRLPALAPVRTAHAVAMSDDGLQWWGNRREGLHSFDPRTEELIQYVPDPDDPANSLSSFTVHDILCRSDGSVWVGTKFGLDKIDPATRRVMRYPLSGDQINTQITAILEGQEGTLWLGTKNGLLYLDPETDSLRRFTRNDGLINTVYTERACYKDKHGVLYFGGDEGIDYFHPDDIGINPVPPDLYIKSASVNNQLVTAERAGECLSELTLSHEENFIEIELVGLHLASPNSVQYAYRLPLQSAEWIHLGKNRVITLARLPPGHYVLEARCANSDGIWSAPKLLLDIQITPPFWQTTWFISLLVIVVAGFIYALYRFRVGQIRRAERIKSELTKRIAEIEMKALRAQMNPHFLFNSLNSVRLLIDTGDNADAKRYLTKFSKLIRQILNNSRKKFIRLDEELETLRLYLELEKMRFKNFRYTIDVANDVESDFVEVPPLLLQPYVENALWHGLMNKQRGDKRLDITVHRQNDHIEVIIEDNGIGREQARRLKTRSKSKKESLGLQISQDRLTHLKELYGSEIAVEIVDLQDPTGTRVIIRMPVSD